MVTANSGGGSGGSSCVAGKSVRGAAAADDTTGAGVGEPVHVAPAAAISCWTARALMPVREIQVRNSYTQAD